eukprot:CAMPEP_0171574184 /NCGR_PEP_ID=MMETSP0961-20121227/5201_1 /TAXON_ID=87120 /ORGANISM="Aurantiochytrium limacinum, Strain ATCCMYA-1381" /LENGTH=33 /DNA_ID= /DNA_START= /DNA_END= /DNA_ORIENTATION=
MAAMAIHATFPGHLRGALPNLRFPSWRRRQNEA